MCGRVTIVFTDNISTSSAASFQREAHGSVYLCAHVNMSVTVKPLCECMCWKKEVTRTSTSFTEHIAVFIRALSGSNTEKKSELRTDGGGSPRLFFLFFFISLIFFFIFLCESTATPAFLWHG